MAVKLVDEHLKSYIDDHKEIGLLNFLTWKGSDVAFAWRGAHEPATRSDDSELHQLAKYNRIHYMFYRALVEKYIEKRGCVLDVGCGSGQRTAMLSRYADRVIGIDSDMIKLAIGAHINSSQNIQWILSDFMEWSETATTLFDYVFAVEVIEHVLLDSQDLFMNALMGRVRHGGSLLITTPRDKEINRTPPHIGLWDDSIASRLTEKLGGEMLYFNAKNIESGGDNPWCDKDSSTHYVISVKQ